MCWDGQDELLKSTLLLLCVGNLEHGNRHVILGFSFCHISYTLSGTNSSKLHLVILGPSSLSVL